MTSEARDVCSDLGRVAAYTLYNLGVGIATGLVRTAIAVAYIAKHAFYSKTFDLAVKASARQRNEDAKGGGFIGKTKAKVGNFVEKKAAKFTKNVTFRDAKKLNQAWKKQLVRGISEIFWIGAPYHTWKDNFGEKPISILALDEMTDLMDREDRLNEKLREYGANPWY